MTRGDGHIEDALYDGLARHYNEEAIVEVVNVIGAFNAFNRINNALRMEPTK